ncbi:hypothetical protein PL_004014 [Pedobacter lusitanus]|nr:hypothetical protein [Pedobacter lusitanus]
MQEDEYWAEFDKESVLEGEDEEGLEEQRANMSKYLRLLVPQNIVTASNSAIHYNSSPYAYVLNNPINYIDPLGLDTGKVKQLKQVNIVENRKSLFPTGQILVGLTTSFPKSFLGFANTGSGTTNLLSSGMSKILPQVMKVRRYTHTNAVGSKIYTKVLGRFLGRWATRVLGPVGWTLTGWDVATMGLPPAGV